MTALTQTIRSNPMAQAATVLPLPKSTTKTPARQIRRTTRATRALRRQAGTAIGIGAVAVTLTALSLSHLAHGIGIVTHADAWEAWAMAAGIDLGFIALELSQLAIGDRKQVARFARPAIFGTLAGSAAMNAFGFAAQAEGYIMIGSAVVLGVAIPALVYALTRGRRCALHRLPRPRGLMQIKRRRKLVRLFRRLPALAGQAPLNTRVRYPTQICDCPRCTSQNCRRG
jgi:hypothetical protein